MEGTDDNYDPGFAVANTLVATDVKGRTRIRIMNPTNEPIHIEEDILWRAARMTNADSSSLSPCSARAVVRFSAQGHLLREGRKACAGHVNPEVTGSAKPSRHAWFT